MTQHNQVVISLPTLEVENFEHIKPLEKNHIPTCYYSKTAKTHHSQKITQWHTAIKRILENTVIGGEAHKISFSKIWGTLITWNYSPSVHRTNLTLLAASIDRGPTKSNLSFCHPPSRFRESNISISPRKKLIPGRNHKAFSC